MSRSHHDGHGRCGVCGDAGKARREREAAAWRADINYVVQEIDERNELYGYGYDECDGRNCLICTDDSWRALELPGGVTVEAE